MQEKSQYNDERSDELDALVSLLPDLYYAANGLLEECIGEQLTKKSGVVLWLIAESNTTDELGPYLLQDDIVDRVAKWFVISKENARSEVSRAKARLMGESYIFVGGGNKNVHLTEKGYVQVRQMRAGARRAMERALRMLNPAEREQLVSSVFRLMTRPKPPARAERPAEGALPRKGVSSALPSEYGKSRKG